METMTRGKRCKECGSIMVVGEDGDVCSICGEDGLCMMCLDNHRLDAHPLPLGKEEPSLPGHTFREYMQDCRDLSVLLGLSLPKPSTIARAYELFMAGSNPVLLYHWR